jgi:WD40 repeat protein
MNWPSPKDFNDAIRNPAAAFTDPDLKDADPVVGPGGQPISRPGDSSDVYQLCAADDRSWAVKCFTRPVPALGHRYARIREALDRAVVPFAVRFDFLDDALRVGGQWCPVLKMDWVEGSFLNEVARDRAGSPAVLDDLFRQWVRLCRELREAGIAHGDLQHRNIILVPGANPGEYAIKLIDYDGMFVPALANEPSGETGHPNYQHLARAAEVYSPDLDRFPHLVIATALKGLSVHGPGLWQRYDTGDNLLFTAADFRNPAASPLLRELWQTNHPVLRTLVGNLVLACLRPIPQTRWLDEIAGDGINAQLTVEEARSVAAALGLRPAVSPLAKPAAPAAPVEVLSLDDEPKAEPSRPVAKSRPKPAPARRSLLVPVAIVAGFLALAGAVIAAVIIAGRNKPDETAHVPPNDPPAKPAPLPPVTPPVTPPSRVESPIAKGPPVFHQVWAKPVAEERGLVRVFFAGDGKTVFVATGGRIEVFDAKTGDPKAELRGPGLPVATMNLWSLDRDRVAVFGFPPKAPGVWDAKTGDALPPLLAQDPLPPPPAGVGANSYECHVSPDGRYVFAGYQGGFRGPAFSPAPYRLLDTTTGKVVAQGDWTNGAVRFTADSSRMLMTETNGRVRWVKLPGGEVEIEWAFQSNGYPRMISGMSADGSLFVYFGKPPGLPFDNYLIDGKTGQVLRRLGTSFTGDRCTLSADGRWLVGLVTEPPDLRRFSAVVADSRTGEVLVRTPLDGDMNDIQRPAFTPDGKGFILHHRGMREVAVYELRGDVAAVAAGAPVPAPLGPIPERVPPGTPVAVDPAPVPLPPPLAGLPPAPALKARWTIATDTGNQANQLPQAALYSKDGKTMILSGGSTGTILTFDPKTGAAGTVFDGHKGVAGVYWLVPFGGDRVVSAGFDAKQATWETRTGKRVDDVKFPELPPMPDGQRGHAGITYTVSPSGRYTVAARKEAARPRVPGPLRILDTTTGEVVVKGDWNAGQVGTVAFTADESRVFVLDGLGKAKWYKLPSGEPDGEWRTGEGVQAEFARLGGMTTDGRTLLYQGPLAGQPGGAFLVDGKTGQVIRRLGGVPYQAFGASLSPDGRFATLVVIDFNDRAKYYTDLFEVATWRLVGRITPPEKSRQQTPHISYSPDGKEIALFYPTAKELSVFALPDGAQAAGPLVPDPKAGNAPVLKARWVATTTSGDTVTNIRYDADAQLVLLSNPISERHAAVDPRNGELLPDRVEGLRRTPGGDLFPLTGSRVGILNRNETEVTVWDLKAGKAGDPIRVPEIPPGPDRHNYRYAHLSPDAKFLVVGRRGVGAPADGVPLRVFDVATGKAVVSSDWAGGTVHFTADSSRVLVAESNGRGRWFKLPSGEADGRWELPGAVGRASEFTSISADGRLVGYTGPGVGADRATVAVLDGKTGAVVRAFGREYMYTSPVSLSADGRLAAVMRAPPGFGSEFTVDVVEVAGGKLVGRATVETRNRSVPTFQLTPDGRALLVHDYNGKNLYWYDLPEPSK